jgi:hypothetical protein
MINRDILASSEILTLLQNNKPKKIGVVKKGKYYLCTDYVDYECDLIAFDFDQNGCEDLFFINSDRLVFHVLSEYSYQNRYWLYELFALPKDNFSASELVELIVKTYTVKELGF